MAQGRMVPRKILCGAEINRSNQVEKVGDLNDPQALPAKTAIPIVNKREPPCFEVIVPSFLYPLDYFIGIDKKECQSRKHKEKDSRNIHRQQQDNMKGKTQINGAYARPAPEQQKHQGQFSDDHAQAQPVA